MSDQAVPLKTVMLYPGAFHFGDGQTRISTLLGSCISISLWHPRKFARVGNDARGIGLRNIERGRELLANSRIPLVAEHLGGSGRRWLHFDLPSGHAWLAGFSRRY